jgi:pimeloyl-ACP methyl ester carboxylesterase
MRKLDGDVGKGERVSRWPALPQAVLPRVFSVALLLLGACTTSGARRVDVGGYHLWTQTAGSGAPTIVFESGGGNDASVWTGVEPEIRRRLGVRTILYDRAGLGKSEPAPGPYRIDDEVSGLQHILDRLGVSAPVVLVAHSYGGMVAALTAARDRRVGGLVFIDVPDAAFVDEAQVAGMMARHAQEFELLSRSQPALARVLKAFPESARRFREAIFPPNLPTIDIVAERPPVDSAEEAAAWRKSHRAFVAASPAREAVTASGSGHFVMIDRPALVIAAVTRMAQRVRKPQSSALEVGGR